MTSSTAEAAVHTEGFAQYCSRSLFRILGTPGTFFASFNDKPGPWLPLGFLALCSLFFTAASLVIAPRVSLLFAGILFLNTLAMPLIASVIAFMVTTLMLGRRTAFLKFFSIFALSGGVTALASWVPGFVWITELWKWWLIGLGMVRGCKIKFIQALLIILFTIGIVVLLFASLAPILTELTGLGRQGYP